MSVEELLLETLQDLVEDEFKTFKWYLSMDVLDGCRPIRKGQLESAARWDVVSKMKGSYGDESAVTITVMILRKMGMNGTAEDLKKDYEAERGKTATAPSSSSSSSAVAAAAPPTMAAQQGSVIFAPQVTGCTAGAWNITINK